MAKNKSKKPLQIIPRNSQVQWRNVNVGMFSGPRPSYQRYSLGPNSMDALRRTGA